MGALQLQLKMQDIIMIFLAEREMLPFGSFCRPQSEDNYDRKGEMSASRTSPDICR